MRLVIDLTSLANNFTGIEETNVDQCVWYSGKNLCRFSQC